MCHKFTISGTAFLVPWHFCQVTAFRSNADRATNTPSPSEWLAVTQSICEGTSVALPGKHTRMTYLISVWHECFHVRYNNRSQWFILLTKCMYVHIHIDMHANTYAYITIYSSPCGELNNAMSKAKASVATKQTDIQAHASHCGGNDHQPPKPPFGI